MNYKLIGDEAHLQNFIDRLPDCGENEMYYISLFARKKYNRAAGVPHDKCQLKRTTATKDRIIHKIRQWEIALGQYKYKDIAIPNDMLVVYITPNPRNLEKATLQHISDITSRLAKRQPLGNPKSQALNCIQNSPLDNKVYFDIDVDQKYVEIDGKSLSVPEWAKTLVKESMIADISLESRGGYHILMKLSEIDNRKKNPFWGRFNNAFAEKLVDGQMNGDNMIPIPGTIQGGFNVRMIM